MFTSFYHACGHNKKKFSMIFFTRLQLFMTIFLFGFFSLTVSAQTEIPPAYHDGNPADWANFQTNYPIHSYKFDVANATTPIDDNYQSAKDVNNILATPPAQSDWT